jgi:hypothetical protein
MREQVVSNVADQLLNLWKLGVVFSVTRHHFSGEELQTREFLSDVVVMDANDMVADCAKLEGHPVGTTGLLLGRCILDGGEQLIQLNGALFANLSKGTSTTAAVVNSIFFKDSDRGGLLDRDLTDGGLGCCHC